MCLCYVPAVTSIEWKTVTKVLKISIFKREVDTEKSVETTISMGHYLNMQMYHSLRCKQIDMSTADQLISIFPNIAGIPD